MGKRITLIRQDDGLFWCQVVGCKYARVHPLFVFEHMAQCNRVFLGTGIPLNPTSVEDLPKDKQVAEVDGLGRIVAEHDFTFDSTITASEFGFQKPEWELVSDSGNKERLDGHSDKENFSDVANDCSGCDSIEGSNKAHLPDVELIPTGQSTEKMDVDVHCDDVSMCLSLGMLNGYY